MKNYELKCINCGSPLSLVTYGGDDDRITLGCMHCNQTSVVTHTDCNKVVEKFFEMHEAIIGKAVDLMERNEQKVNDKKILPPLPVCLKGGYHGVKNIRALDFNIPDDKDLMEATEYRFAATCMKCNGRILATYKEEYTIPKEKIK